MLFHEDLLAVIRRELNRDAPARLNVEDVFKAVRDVLSNEALAEAGNLGIRKKWKRRRKVQRTDEATGASGTSGETLTRTLGGRLRSTPHTERIMRLAAANGIGAMVGSGRGTGESVEPCSGESPASSFRARSPRRPRTGSVSVASGTLSDLTAVEGRWRRSR